MRHLLLYFLLSMIYTPLFAQTAQQAGGAIVVSVVPVFDGRPLVLGSTQYVNEHDDTLYIDLFRFYITNLRLVGPANAIADHNSHLIDAEESSTTIFYIDKAAPGTYTAIEFSMGVDSIANTNGANGGDLDPTKGMYWAWNTGYIMAKLEGRSNRCRTLHHAFEFHIGGYMPPYNAARTVRLQLPAPVTVSAGSTTAITLWANTAAWFNGTPGLAVRNNIVIPGAEAMLMADNYSRMFSIK